MKLAVVVCALASAGVIAAAPARAQTGAERDDARGHFARGIELIQAERWQEAIPELEAARDIAVTPAVLFNLALAQRAVGQTRSAIATFEEFLARSGGAISAERLAETRGYLRELRGALARVTVQVDAPDAAISVDGVPTAAHDGEIDLDPGRHVVSAQAAGYRPASRTIYVRQAVRETLELHLTALSPVGRIQVECDVPAAVILVDGRDVGSGRINREVSAGQHRIDVRAPGYVLFRDDVTVAPDSTVRVRARLVGQPTPLTNPWLWSGVGLAVAAVTVGGYLLFLNTEPERNGNTWGVINLPGAQP